MATSASPEPARRIRAIDFALVLWPSFLAACAASVLFFAAVDPAMLRDAGPHLFAGLDREAGYALGFLFFWGVGALASTVSIYLIRTERGGGRADPPGAA
ncbi:MAG TPA: hypothetical protein VGR80_07115 [Steroidobacteraceae bacterium]|nr:hypothetical protein [Gammaproteobacteria bacterium]HEV2285795.1 hypothetical protein [Steroidobacteraceae bacterium]